MGDLPFAASFDALALIVKQIRSGASQSNVTEHVPALCACMNSCAWEDATGRIVEHIPYEHYLIGWYRPEDVTDAVEVDVLGWKLFIHPETLQRLAGKQLVKTKAQSDLARPAAGTREILIAVARPA